MAHTQKTDSLFEALLQATATAPTQRIPRNITGTPPPLAFAQQRLWLLDQLEPNNPAYNVLRAFRLTGRPDIGILEMCVNEIVRRHDALRTTFATVEGQPVQITTSATDLVSLREDKLAPLSVIDLSGLTESEREEKAQEIVTQESRTVFELTQFPLLRTTLLQLGEEEYIFLLVIHHIVSDGWSISVFFQELASLYEAFSVGKSSPLPELSIQYADFAVWQRGWLQGETLESQLSYWRKQLGGELPVLDLPTNYPRPAIQTFRGARQLVALSPELTEALRRLGQQEGTTLFMTLLTAFQTLLYRYSGQEDIIVGSPIANRNQAQITGLIGFFVNTLALRTNLSNDPRFKELLAQVRQMTLEAYAHQDLPFEKLVEELQPERDLSHSPLFQVMFVLQNTPQPVLEFSGLRLYPLVVDNGTAKFDLTLTLSERSEGLEGSLEYNTDLFEADTIKRMVGHFQTLLAGIVADPETPISRLPILTEAERHQLLVEWNDTHTDYPKDMCIHQLFEAQAQQTPDSVAVVFDNQQLTYRELNSRANQLAHHLKKCGVGPEVLVGICVERSLEMIVGLLGILKAGGAYVPLDPTHPKERLAFMLGDTQAPVLLTQSQLAEKLPECKAQMICVDSDWNTIAKEDKTTPRNSITTDNLAYVIYTSGSTGNPKGTMIVHRGLVNYLSWCTTAYRVAEADGAPVQSSIGFDATITSLFSPLLVGRRVLLLPERQEIEALCDVLQVESNFSLIKITPAHLEILHQLLPPSRTNSQVKTIVVGGEALTKNHLLFWRTNFPDTQLINEYGPTETVVGCCVYNASTQTFSSDTVPIGSPIANTQIYLLDPHQQPVPIGVVGELYIGGDGLARGYLNRPELTAEKFITNPFGKESSARLYKTGDLARYLPDGNIEFLGRLDHQVKIRGFRIELGEIETVLGQHQAAQQVVVLAQEKGAGEKRLIAYVAPKQGQTPTISELRNFLKQKLPEYMAPAAFLFMDTLPLTPNGKIDRRALPPPEQVQSEPDTTLVPPRTPIEELLAEMWIEMLDLKEVGIHDDFFELGGHSLLAIQLIAWIRRDFEVELSVLEVFEEPTIAGLAINIIKKQVTTGNNVAELLDMLEQLSEEDVEILLESD